MQARVPGRSGAFGSPSGSHPPRAPWFQLVIGLAAAGPPLLRASWVSLGSSRALLPLDPRVGTFSRFLISDGNELSSGDESSIKPHWQGEDQLLQYSNRHFLPHSLWHTVLRGSGGIIGYSDIATQPFLFTSTYCVRIRGGKGGKNGQGGWRSRAAQPTPGVAAGIRVAAAPSSTGAGQCPQGWTHCGALREAPPRPGPWAARRCGGKSEISFALCSTSHAAPKSSI